MHKDLRIDTEIKSLAYSELKLEVGHFTIFWVAINDNLATQANLGCLKMVPMDFLSPTTWG